MASKTEDSVQSSKRSITPPQNLADDAMKDRPTVVCVFCGSRDGATPAHMEAARSLAHSMHKHNINLVFGGGTKGMMGEIARTLVSLSGGDAVHGVIPNALVQFEQPGLTKSNAINGVERVADAIDENLYGRTTVVPDMHVRKQMMAKEVIEGGPGSGFVALSGGYGTLEELAEMTTWNQLGIHNKGVVLFNVEGYYDGLIQFVQKAVSTEFISTNNADIIVEARSAEDCVIALRDYKVAEGRFKLDWTTN